MNENRMIPINSVSDYPNASFANNPKQAEQQRKRREKQEAVIDQKDVTVKKKNAFKRLKKKIVDDNGKNLMDFVIKTGKDALWDIGTNALDILLYGEAKHLRQNSGGIIKNGPYVRYNTISNIGLSNSNRTRDIDCNDLRGDFAIDDFIFQTRVKADYILSRMRDIIDRSDYATVADLYNLCRTRCPYTYDSYVWTDLSEAKVVMVRDGYLLSLPPPRALNEIE